MLPRNISHQVSEVSCLCLNLLCLKWPRIPLGNGYYYHLLPQTHLLVPKPLFPVEVAFLATCYPVEAEKCWCFICISIEKWSQLKPSVSLRTFPEYVQRTLRFMDFTHNKNGVFINKNAALFWDRKLWRQVKNAVCLHLVYYPKEHYVSVNRS